MENTFYVKTKTNSESHMECIFGNVGIYIVILDSCFVMFGRLLMLYVMEFAYWTKSLLKP